MVSRSRFWNRAEFYTLMVVQLILLLAWIPLFLATAPLILATRSARWLHDVTSKRMKRLNAIHHIVAMHNPAKRSGR